MPRSEDLIASVADENVKVGAGAPSHYAAVAMKATADAGQAMSAHFARLNMIAETALQNGITVSQAATASAVKSLTELDAVEAMSTAIVGQQGAKVAQSTPPETARPTTGADK